MASFRAYILWILIIVSNITSGAVVISKNCESNVLLNCSTSINDALSTYHNEEIFNIEPGFWFLSKNFKDCNKSFIGNCNNNTLITFDLNRNNIISNDCNLYFENITILIPNNITISRNINNGRLIVNGSSILSMTNVNIMSDDENNNESIQSIEIFVFLLFYNNAKFICNKCTFHDIVSLSIQFYDTSMFEAKWSMFEDISTHLIDPQNDNLIILNQSNGFILGNDNINISLDNCFVSNNILSPMNFIHILNTKTNTNYNINIIDSQFINNDGGNGGILRLAPNGNISIKSTIFINNDGDDGGIIYAEHCNINIIDCNITNNKAEGNGGVIYMENGFISLQSIQFTSNTAGIHGGVLYGINIDINANDVNWTSNEATIYGAGIFILQSSFIMTSSQWIENTAAEGVAIDAEQSNIICIHCLFKDNIGKEGNGGLIWLFIGNLSLNHVNIINTSTASTFADNALGGALYVIHAQVSMDNVTMNRNTVEGFGGSIYGWDSKINVTNSYFYNNHATISGGIMFIGSSILNIFDSTMIHNQAPNGSCIYGYNSSLNIYNNIIQHNIAWGSGACLFINSSYLQLLDSDASDNSAQSGNGSVLQITGIHELINNDMDNMDNIININNCTFSDNIASHGGAVYIDIDNDIYPKTSEYLKPTPSTPCNDDDDEDKICFIVNVSTISDEITNTMVNIAEDRHNKESIFEVRFVISENDCINPTISLDYELIDYNDHDEYIKVYDNNNTEIKQCGQAVGGCNEFANCLDDHNLGIDKISVGQYYVISLLQKETVRSKCYVFHRLSMNAQLQLKCNPNTVNITNQTASSSLSNNYSCNDTISYLIIKSNENDQKQVLFSPYYSNNRQIGSKYIGYIPFRNSSVYGANSINCYDIDDMEYSLNNND